MRNNIKKKTTVSIFISQKVDFRKQETNRPKKYNLIMIKRSINQEKNIYVPPKNAFIKI